MYLIYMYKLFNQDDLGLNNLQESMRHKSQPTITN